MAALKEEPIGYKAWSRSNTPIFLPPDGILDNSIQDRDAMLLLISNLIRENQSLKSENKLLRKEMLKDQANSNSSVEAKEAATGSSKPYRKPKQSHQETFNWESSLKRCKFCGTRHVWGKSRCPTYEKELDKISKFNSLRTIASTRNAADEESSDGKKNGIKSRGFSENSTDAIPEGINSDEGLNLVKQKSSSVSLEYQIAENTVQNTKQADNQSGMLNGKEPRARSRDRPKCNLINGKMYKSVTETMKLKEKYPKCRKSKQDQKEKDRNSAKKTWSEQKAECMKILRLTIDPYENEKMLSEKRKCNMIN